MVRNDLAKKYQGEDVEFFIVYIPMLGSDNKEAAENSLKDWEDPRFKIYWDGDREIGKSFGKTLEMKVRNGIAWDMYFLFDGGTKWKDDAPKPSYWMHQLSGLDRQRLLDGKTLQQELKKLIDKQILVFLTRDGCVNTPVMRKSLDGALQLLSLESYVTIDVGDLHEDDPRLSYGTPTLLVDGKDLMGLPKATEPGFPG